MSHWMDFETFLVDQDQDGLRAAKWSSRDISAKSGMPADLVKVWIQEYLRAQRNKRGPKTLYVIHRVPGTRTSNALWSIGVRGRDRQEVHKQITSDATCRYRREIKPVLIRIGQENPRALPAVEASLKVIEGSLELMAGMLPDGDGPAA